MSDGRDACVFSIDPPTARDLDDALSIEKLGDDRFKVGVHIADVSHFVKPGTALDHVAQKRTTSVYLIQRVIPMLPERLSANLCSLNPGKDRLTFSVVWEMNGEGEILKQHVQKSIIHSATKMGYHHAQSAIDDPSAVQPENLQIHGGYTWDKVKRLSLTETLMNEAAVAGESRHRDAFRDFAASPEKAIRRRRFETESDKDSFRPQR